jgi:hypothetical protein
MPVGGGAGGTFYAHVSVHNVGDSSCSLHGRPFIALVDKTGRIFQSTGRNRLRRRSRTVVLTPNSWATVDLGAIASDTCGGDQTTTLRIRLPGTSSTRSMRFPVGRPPDPRDCGGTTVGAAPHPGQLHVGPFQSIPRPQDDFIVTRQLSTTITVPAQAARGSTLTFMVSFTNPTANSLGIDDSPCPIFQLQLTGTAAGGTYLLPCTPVVSIAAGETIAYQMRVLVPATVDPGPTTLSWQLREPEEPAHTARVQLV